MTGFSFRVLCTLVSLCAAPRAAAAHEGWGIVRDAHGRLYVADIPANTVWRIDRDGRLEPVLRDVHTHALVLGADGAIYGTNVHPSQPIRSVWRLDMSGRMTWVVPATRGFALDLQPFLLGNDGTIYSVSLYQPALPPAERQLFVLRRSPHGVVDTVAGGLRGHADGTGAGAKFTSIDGMAWLPDSSILLVDGARLRRLTRAGEVRSLTAELTSARWDQDLMGLSVHGGAYYVADFAGRRVLRVTHSERNSVTSRGWYWAPAGVLATPDGIYTLEHPRAPLGILGDLGIGPYLRTRLIRHDGSSEVVARAWGRNTPWLAAMVGGVAMLVVGARAWLRS